MQREYEYLVAQIKRALASDPRLGCLDLKVGIHEGTVNLIGEVETEAQREAAAAIAVEAAPGLRVRNEIAVRELNPAARPERIDD